MLPIRLSWPTIAGSPTTGGSPCRTLLPIVLSVAPPVVCQPRPSSGEATVVGSLDKDVIRRVIQGHIGEVSAATRPSWRNIPTWLAA